MQEFLPPDNPSPLIGLRVQFDGGRNCCGNIAVIGRGVGPHAAELNCAACGSHRGWLSKSTAAWLETVITKFGAPTTPIVLRRPSSSHDSAKNRRAIPAQQHEKD
jgi:hypothetical protein